jgi:hypothetical protein
VLHFGDGFGEAHFDITLGLTEYGNLGATAWKARSRAIGNVLTDITVPAQNAFSLFLHWIGQDTEPLDLHFEDIAGLHENGWLTRRSDTTRRPGDDHITSLQT